MLELTRRIESGTTTVTLTLPLERRTRARMRVTLDNGISAGIFLDRGPILRHGDLIASDAGDIVKIQAAAEPVSTVRCDDALSLARASYHLGNRHVPLQIGSTFVRYQHDHVLDSMIRGLGLAVTIESAPFEPEPGAYGGGHRHGESGDRGNDHGHNHGHALDFDHQHD